MTEKPHLSIVPKREPTPKEAVIERIKAMPRPDGALFCPQCGGMASATITSGAVVKKGRKSGGTVIAKDFCLHCFAAGVRKGFASPAYVQMISGRPKPETAK